MDEVTVQDLLDTLRDLAAKPEAMDDDEIVDAGGKEAGVVAVTMTLFNAQVKFTDTGSPRLCKISGGNIFAKDVVGSYMSPVAYNTNVTVAYAQSTAAALVQDADIDAIKVKTDNLPIDPAAQSLVQDVKDRIGTPASLTIADDLGEINAEVQGVKGAGWTDETLKKIKELIEVERRGASFRV